MHDDEDIKRLKEIQKEIWGLVENAEGIIDAMGYDEILSEAKHHWMKNILGLLSNDYVEYDNDKIKMEDTIRKLEDELNEEED